MAGILIIAEHLQGRLHDISSEMIGAAVKLKDSVGGPVTVAVVAPDPAPFIEGLNLAGVDRIAAVTADAQHFDPLVYEEVALMLGQRLKPSLILAGHTANGMAYAAALAARLGSGFASDVFGLEAIGTEIVATRGGYGSKVNVELGFAGKGVVVLTLRGATFQPPTEAGSAAVEAETFDVSGIAGRIAHLDYAESPPSGIDISKAEFILSVGRGIQDKENLPQFEALAKRLGATFGCSRPIVDSGWLPKPHQVGQSGKVAANCKLYIAFGISGAVQHLFGMKHVDTIIAINTDPEAPIFNIATYGACIDLFELSKELERQVN